MERLGEQLTGMLRALKRYEDTNSDNQETNISFMSLVWPLLPLLPPEPPTILQELLREPEMCDVCGIAQGRPLFTCEESRTCLTHQSPVVDEGMELRQRNVTVPEKSRLDRLMLDIKKKVDQTLSSIENTAQKSKDLSQQSKEFNQSMKPVLTDAEMLKRLKKLVDEKAKKEEKVKNLEFKEKQLRDNLITAINWAKNIETQNKYDSDDRITEDGPGSEDAHAQQSEEVAINK